MNILAAESANPLLPPVGEIIVGLITFAILAFVVIKYVVPRFEQVFVARREAIEGGIERIRRERGRRGTDPVEQAPPRCQHRPRSGSNSSRTSPRP